MKTLLSLKSHHYVARTTTFLIAVALIVGMMGCAASPVPKYELTISSTEGGSVTTPGEGSFSYDEGASVDLAAAPDTGYRFVGWIGDVGTIADVDSATTTITMDTNHSVEANFEAIPATQYTLTVSSTGGGSVTSPGEPGPYTYAGGTVVDLEATPDAGYRFVNWTGDVGTIADVDSATTTITMDANHSVEANFEAIPATQYTLTVSSTGGGSVTSPGEPGPYVYDEGQAVDLVAEADEGYRFVNWSGDVDTIADVNDATTTITMNGDYAISASFGVEQVVVYDFVAKASHISTVWKNRAGTLPFPGATDDNRGFACYRTNVVLEDNHTYDKVLETHPEWVDDGYIAGLYTELYDTGHKIESGDRFYAKVGLLKNATAGNVKFVVWIVREEGYAVAIAEITDMYDGTLQIIDVDLSSYASDYVVAFALQVWANGSSAQDWAVWVEAKITNVGDAISSGTITIPGTMSFDFDAGVVSGFNEDVDVFWQQHTSTTRAMTPRNGATIANLGVVDFNAITPADLMGLTYGTTPIDGSDVGNVLVPGDVFAVHTNAGNYAKAKVVTWGYSIAIEWVTY